MAKTVVYEIYSPCYKNFRAIEDQIDRAHYIGVDVIYLTPFYPSGGVDGGYDITNYTDVDPRYGTLEDFERLVDHVHDLGMKIVIDLVLNHTSIEHPWFRSNPEYYYRRNYPLDQWTNFFDGGSAWEYDGASRDYYLHLFHPAQADLRWHIAGHVNRSLIAEFQKIITFWYYAYGVDGFRLSMPQAINKQIQEKAFDVGYFFFGHQAIEVINAVFEWSEHPAYVERPFLIAECFDPTHGGLAEYYAKYANVNFVTDVTLKNELKVSLRAFRELKKYAEHEHLLLEFESHDSPRFQIEDMEFCDPKWLLWEFFGSGANGVCLYQGQELGTENPSSVILPEDKMFSLDVRSKMLWEKRCKDAKSYAERERIMREIRKNSRANGRIKPHPYVFRKQLKDVRSVLNLACLASHLYHGGRSKQ